MQNEIITHYIGEFEEGRDVAASDSEVLFTAIIAEENEELLSDFLRSWAEKGATENEMFEFAKIMRRRMRRITSMHSALVDVVGTGGSGSKRFNVSTAAAFVAAGAGVAVAKHGNRAATSDSGSADVLALLGIKVDLEPEAAETCLNDIGICFMFAPRFHSLSPKLARVRRALGRPTIFNNLGPLCNPAGAQHQLIGVWSRELLDKTANVLSRLGCGRSWVVHGSDGLDEITHGRISHIVEANGHGVRSFDLTPSDFGIEIASDDIPARCNSSASAALIREILGNERREQAVEQIVLMNAAAAIHLAMSDADLPTAFEMATESVRSGAARQKLTKLAEKTNE